MPIGMAELTNPGAIIYGQFRWPTNTETVGFSATHKWSADGRTIIYTVYRVSLRAILAGRAVDNDMRVIVQRLSRPAFPFVYSGSGFALQVNVGSVRDVAWGPKPISANAKMLGGGNAVELTWEVETAIPDGPTARFQFAPMDFSWSLSYDIDASGYTTRTYSGMLSIPMTRKSPNDRTLPDNIDSYREDVYPPLITGFRRVPGSWVISPDKSEARFSCQDIQMPPAAPWPGIVECSADHTVSCAPGKFYTWNGTISGTYEVARNGTATAADARNAFFALVKDQINYLQNKLRPGGELRTSGNSSTPAFVMPVAFSMTNPNIYGRTTAKYSLSYSVSSIDLKGILRASGIWRLPPGGLDFKGWADSLKTTVMSARGHAGLAFSVNDDQIVDLFQPAPVLSDLSSRAPGADSGLGMIPSDVFPEPTPDDSWLSYNQQVYFESDAGVVEIRTLPTEPRTDEGDMYGGITRTATNTGLGAFEGLWNAGQQLNPFYFPPPRTPSQQKKGGLDKRQAPQRRGRQGGAIYLIGSATRVRFAIPAPTLTRWGTAKLTPANRPDRGEGFWTGVVGNALWPVVGARWRLRWLVDDPPAATPPALPNPLMGGGGEAAAALGSAIGDVLAGSMTWGR